MGLGLTQVELAERTGYAPVTLRKVEADTLRPSIAMADRLAAELNVPHEQRPAFVRFARLAVVEAARHGASDLDTPFQSDDSSPQYSLPSLPASLIGREHELAHVEALLLQEATRLVTLTGPGGVGKTSLALETAWSLRAHPPSSRFWRLFRDGVCFVPLAHVTDPALVLATIAHALRLQEAGGRRPLDTLRENLRDRRLLLVLDNFEHVIGAAPLLAQLLRDCPGLKMLVTSREGLHLRGEKEVAVEPLPVPQGTPSVGDLLCNDAVRLFVERAQDARHGFALTAENAATVAEICRRLDGLPLALELAASRVKALPPQEILRRLTDSLAFLTQGARDLPDRHRALRATIDWSYNLLDEPERLLFRRLSVFAGGCSLAAFDAVCNGDLALGDRALDHLMSLVDKSLVRLSYDSDGQPRYSMLETIREYAAERLVDSGDRAYMYERRARYYLRLAEDAAPHLARPEQMAWLDRLGEEVKNLRAVLAWSLSGEPHTDPTLALQLAGTLWRFWETRGFATEGAKWLATALAVTSPETHGRLYARALLAACLMAVRHDDHMSARAWGTRTVELARRLGDMRLVARGLTYLAWSFPQEEVERAIPVAEEALVLSRQVGDPWGLALALNIMGRLRISTGELAEAESVLRESATLLHNVGDRISEELPIAHLGGVYMLREEYVAATPWLEAALARAQAAGNKMHAAADLKSLGCAAYGRGDYVAAEAILGEARRLYQETGVMHRAAASQRYLAYAVMDHGDPGRALPMLTESLATVQGLKHREESLDGLVGLALWLTTAGRPAPAARLLGAVEALRVDRPTQLGKVTDRVALRRALSETQAALGETRFAALSAAGAAMDLDAALAYGLAAVATSD